MKLDAMSTLSRPNLGKHHNGKVETWICLLLLDLMSLFGSVWPRYNVGYGGCLACIIGTMHIKWLCAKRRVSQLCSTSKTIRTKCLLWLKIHLAHKYRGSSSNSISGLVRKWNSGWQFPLGVVKHLHTQDARCLGRRGTPDGTLLMRHSLWWTV